MEKAISIDVLKALQLEIMIYVHEFCMAYDIKYSLSGGSLLGAVRHKGFIPWDDDIDIMMIRSEYEKFIEKWTTYMNHPYILHCSQCGNSEGLAYGKVSNPKTFSVLAATGQKFLGVDIDIFPIDDVLDENDFIERHNRSLELQIIKWKVSQPLISNTIKSSIRNLAYRLEYINYSAEKVRKLIDKNAQMQNGKGGQFVFEMVMGVISKKYFPKNLFDEYILLNFEGHSFYSIRNYHQYLSSTYGDYMQLPPIEKRVTHHNLLYFWK